MVSDPVARPGTPRTLRRVRIAGLSTFVPPKLLTNHDLELLVETTDEWILQRTGIRHRHIVEPGVATSDLSKEADRRIQAFQRDAARDAGIFHHLITLPTYHTAALSTDNLAKGYFGEEGMLAYVAGVQRKEIREGIACVKHQNMSGSDIGDDHKEYFAGEAALKAGGAHNTMNQF